MFTLLEIKIEKLKKNFINHLKIVCSSQINITNMFLLKKKKNFWNHNI